MSSILINIPTLIAALAFLAIFLLFMGVWQFFRLRTKKRELIDTIQRGGENRAESADPKPAKAKERTALVGSIVDFLTLLGRRVTNEEVPVYSPIRIKFIKAGLRRPGTPAVFWGTKAIFAVGLPLVFFLSRITVFEMLKSSTFLTLCLVLALAGFYLPDLWLIVRSRRRKRGMTEGLPDFLDLLAVCVEAGMGLDGAINRVSDEMRLSNKELSDELKILILEMRAGKLRRDALRNLALRTDLEDMNSLVTLLIQTEKFGTSIAQALRVYADSFRSKRYQRAEEIAAKMPVKLTIPLILFIFPALFVVILGPAIIRFYHVLLQQ
jgi:tight adherence protein C